MDNSNKTMTRPSLPRSCKRKSMLDNDGDSGISKKRRRSPTRASPRLRCKAYEGAGAELSALPEGKCRYDDGLTALMRAALSADMSSFRKLTRVKTVAWSKLDTFGRNLLHCAAQGGSPGILSTVIESRVVELDAQAGPGGPTALHYCLDRQDAEAASLLLAAGASPGIFEAETLSDDTFRYPRTPSPPSTPPYNSGALRSSPPNTQDDGPFPVMRGAARTNATQPRELGFRGTSKDDMIATLQSALRKAVVAMDERKVPWLDEKTQHALYQQWCCSLRPGALVDACDCDGKWYEASVVAVQPGSPRAVQVRFRCWGRRFDETIQLETLKVLPAFSVVTPWREMIAVGSGVEVLSTTSTGSTAREERKWWDATVQFVDRARRRVLLSVEGRGGAARWCDLDGEEISDIGTHVKPFPLLPNFPRGKEPLVPTHRQELAREAARSCDRVGLLRLIPIVDPHVMLFQYYRCKLSVIQAWPAKSRGCDDGNLSPLQGPAAFEEMMRARVEGGHDVVCVTGPQLDGSRSQTEDTRKSVMGHVLTEMKEDLFRELLRGFMVR